MFIKLFHIELPEWATGGLGLLFISLAVGSSIWEAKSANKLPVPKQVATYPHNKSLL